MNNEQLTMNNFSLSDDKVLSGNRRHFSFAGGSLFYLNFVKYYERKFVELVEI